MSVVWRKSSRSNGAQDANCVEIALDGSAARIRDSKGQADTVIAVTAWGAFLDTVKNGELDGR